MELPATGHDPVLLNQTLQALAPKAGETFVDCTLGRGGHALAISRCLGKGGTLIGIDADPRNLEYARDRLTADLGSDGCTLRFFHANFSELGEVLAACDLPAANAVDGILADLGISTNQLFDQHYGMSFGQDMPLDMRIDPRVEISAADVVNSMDEEKLANVLYELAQERYSRRIARKIGAARRISPINSTEQLAALVRQAIGLRAGAPQKIDPATRTFLALRMTVNREMENLGALMESAPKFLKPGGRLAVISFQSTEDRLVKIALRNAEENGTLRLLTKKPIDPTDEEVRANPRSRSAKLRAAMRNA